MKQHHIDKNDLNTDYTETQHKDAVAILNGIYDCILNGGYTEGCRNNLAVDLCCCEHVLGMDLGSSVWPLLGNEDRHDLDERVNVIDEYLWLWDREFHGVFDKMFTTADDWQQVPEHFVIDE